MGRDPGIPVRPDTLVGKMYYLAGARMVDDMEGVEWEEERVGDGCLRGLGKMYDFRVMRRRGGRRALLVDEVGDEDVFREV